MNYQHLKYFREIARSKTFQQSADKLFITQPTLSRAISTLEEELGVKLFEKSGRTVQITPYGLKFLEYVNISLNAIEEGVEALRVMENRVDGNLVIASIYGYTYDYLPDIIHRFESFYPNIHFQLRQATTQDVLSQVQNGDVDFGFHCISSHMEKYQDLEYTPIQKEKIVVAVSKHHPFARKKSCSIKELISERIVSFDSTSGMLYKTREMFEQTGCTFQPGIFVSDDQSILNIVHNSGAIAFVLQNITANYSNIATLEIEDDVDPTMTIYFANRKKNVHSATFNAFRDFLLDISRNNI